MDRLAFFFEQLVVAADLATLEDNIENAERSVVADILGFGLLVGGANPATVVQNTPTANLSVKVNQFLGYDQAGKRLSNLRSGYQGGVNKGAPPPQVIDLSVDEVAAPTAVSGVGNEKTLSVFIKFRRHAYTDRTDGNNATVKYNQDESIDFNVVQSAEAPLGTSVPTPYRTDQVLLCDVKLIKNQTQILNADISTSRQQAFELLLPHGASHVSSGSDPIPAATTLVGGLLSASDKTKLDSITFTKAGIGALFDNQFHLFKPADITSPAGTTLDVTARMAGVPAGGSASVEGAVTQVGAATGDNVVYLLDSKGNEVKSSANNRIYAKLTVDNEGTPTAWTLSFFTRINGVETAYDFTPQAGITLQWWVNRSYRLDHLPVNVKPWLVPRNQATGNAVAGQKNGAGTTGYQPVVNFIQGSNISITVAENTGNKSIDITIAATTSGAFPGFGSATNPDTSGGSGGGTGVAADAGHQHSASTIYRHTSGTAFVSGTGLPNTSIGSLGFAIAAIAAIASAAGGGNNGAISVGFYDSSGNQRSVYLGTAGANGGSNSRIADTTLTGAGGAWTASGMGTNTINLTASGGVAATGAALAIGSPH